MIRNNKEFNNAQGNSCYFSERKPTSPVYDGYCINLTRSEVYDIINNLVTDLYMGEGNDKYQYCLQFYEEVINKRSGAEGAV